MKREQFVDTFLEGSRLSLTGDSQTLIKNLVGMVFDLRKDVSVLKEEKEYMDDIARDNTIQIECRSCQQKYTPDCELSEITHEGNYCGRSEFCCP